MPYPPYRPEHNIDDSTVVPHYVEEIRVLRRKLARAEAALRDVKDNAVPGSTNHFIAEQTLEQNAKEAA